MEFALGLPVICAGVIKLSPATQRMEFFIGLSAICMFQNSYKKNKQTVMTLWITLLDLTTEQKISKALDS